MSTSLDHNHYISLIQDCLNKTDVFASEKNIQGCIDPLIHSNQPIEYAPI